METVCAYGDCEERVSKAGFKLTITESSNGTVWDRQSFCCYEHAILWLHRKDTALNRRQWPAPREAA